MTCNPDAPAKEFVDKDKVFVFPKNSEPYTYNTSTYMGMILAKTREDFAEIKKHITSVVDPLLVPHFGQFDAFCFIVPDCFDSIREMLLTKFDELFQPRISGRVFTVEQSRHAKTVVRSDTELFVGIGYNNENWGTKRLNISLPENTWHGGVMAVGYYVIGKIQKQNVPWFKKGISKYCERASKLFNEKINPFVF